MQQIADAMVAFAEGKDARLAEIPESPPMLIDERLIWAGQALAVYALKDCEGAMLDRCLDLAKAAANLGHEIAFSSPGKEEEN